MARFGFCGPAYQSASLSADNQALINMYLEADESGQGESGFILLPSPGTALFSTLVAGVPIGGVRGGIQINGRVFFVCGTNLWEVNSLGAATNVGNVQNDGLQASLAVSVTQLFMASGGIPYSLDLTTPGATLQPVAQLINGGISVSMVGYSDGFFIALKANSQTIYVSAVLDANTWDLTNFTAVSVFPDKVLSMIIDHREIWLHGATKTTVYYNSGGALFPYDVVPGGFIEQGIAAPATSVRMDNSVFWLGSDDRGAGIAWRAQQYTPARISNHALENEWLSYPTITDAVGYSFQIEGHTNWHLLFPSASKAWRYDAAVGQWHQVAYLESNGSLTAHRSQCHVYGFGKHLVGDWNSGRVFDMELPSQNSAGVWSFATDVGGNLIKRLRRAPHISKEKEWMFHSSLQVDVEVGVGPVPALTTDGNAVAADFSNARGPRMILRFSNTSGKTWSNDIILDCGQSGELLRRVIARRLGKSRDRIYEISMTDPIGWKIIDAYLKADPDFKPTERLVKQLGKGA